MLRRRTRLDILRDILDGCRSASTKTRLMYTANMNFYRIDAYLKLLHHYNLVKETSSSNNVVLYQITEKGEKFLKLLEEVKKYVKEL